MNHTHRWIPPFSGLMVCALCGESRSAPFHLYFDADGYVRHDSDAIHEQRKAEAQRREERETRERRAQLREDLEAIHHGEVKS